MSENMRVTYEQEPMGFTELNRAEVSMGTVHLARLHSAKRPEADLRIANVTTRHGVTSVESEYITTAKVQVTDAETLRHTYTFDATNAAEPLVYTLDRQADPEMPMDRVVATEGQEGYALLRQFNDVLFDIIEDQGL